LERAMPKVLHPHITSDSAICGGSPCIAGTRFSVRVVVGYVLHLGLTPEELQADFPHLSLAAIYDALSYYYDNRVEVDAEIKANDELSAQAEASR
jgi:uncharacterized protein (DUF433 family)